MSKFLGYTSRVFDLTACVQLHA